MKKRSVLSAVAMLLVSALVLTSATYAWFAAGATASVSAITTTVTGSDNSIVLSPNGGTNWYSTLTEAIITADSSEEKFPATFTPIDWNGSEWIAGVLSGSDFSAGYAPAGSTSYLYYTFNVKSLGSALEDAEITPAITFADDFVYAMITVTDTNGTRTTIYNTDTTSYNPIEIIDPAISGTAIDLDADGVIETGESLDDIQIALTPITPTTLATTGVITLDIPAIGSSTVSVWMWAEGQDYDCHGSASGSDASIGLTITPA